MSHCIKKFNYWLFTCEIFFLYLRLVRLSCFFKIFIMAVWFKDWKCLKCTSWALIAKNWVKALLECLDVNFFVYIIICILVLSVDALFLLFYLHTKFILDSSVVNHCNCPWLLWFDCGLYCPSDAFLKIAASIYRLNISLQAYRSFFCGEA